MPGQAEVAVSFAFEEAGFKSMRFRTQRPTAKSRRAAFRKNMIAFDVFLNRKKLVRAGVGTDGVLTGAPPRPSGRAASALQWDRFKPGVCHQT
jgi:hypothetical protein